MRRPAMLLGLLALAVAACSRPKTTGVEPVTNPLPPPPPGTMAVAQVGEGSGMSRPRTITATFSASPEDTPRDAASPLQTPITDPGQRARYDAAITRGIELMADRKWAEALASFQAAEFIQSTVLTKVVTDRLKRRLDEEKTAEHTIDNIQAVLDAGAANEAADLATEALKEFAHTDSLERLLKLKRQADSIAVVGIEDRRARFDRFHREYDAAVKDNKRAALLALEQALQYSDDEALQAKYDGLAADLTRYDELRNRAAELRLDSERLEEAIAALEQAMRIWDTPAVRQDLDECHLALVQRPDRLAVLDFEVRGDVGLPEAGAFVAEAILPAFRGSYHVVERGQVGKVIEELRLQGDFGDDFAVRQALERAIRARYLVLGSVTPICGLTVQARLVDAQSGLVMQTARLSAPTPEKLAEQLPQLARDLMMNDIQNLPAEEKRSQEATQVEVVKPGDLTKLLPPPDPPPADVPLPAPVIPARPKAPDVAGLRPEQLEELPPTPGARQDLTLPVLAAERELELRRRALFAALELGDNLFRRGRFREALDRYEFALTLFPEISEVRLRVERCRPLLVPFPVIVPPRVAIFDFLVVGHQDKVPRYLAYWVPENLTPYLAPEMITVDRPALFWWMGRLGLTQADLVVDPVARVYLSRALGARSFLFGSIVHTGSFNVTTYLVDAEYGYLASSARIHVRGDVDLKRRLGELAWLTKLSPEQRRRVEEDNAQWALLMSDIRTAERLKRIEAHEAVIALCNKGLQLRPNNVELLWIRHEAVRNQQADLSQRRHSDEQGKLNDMAVARGLDKLASQAESARQRTERAASADPQRLESQRRAVAEEIVRRAQLMVQTKRYSVAVQLFASATALRPEDDGLYRELALARAKAEETARATAAEAQATREADLRRKREEALAAARAALEAERKRRQADEASRRRADDERKSQEAERLTGLAQQFSAKQQYDQAVAVALQVKQLQPTPEAERLVSQLLVELARSNAEKRGAAARAELERQLTAERAARIAAEAEAERNRKLYESLVAQGQKALQQEKFAEAREQFAKARQLHETDAVLTGLKQAEAGEVRREAQLAAEQKRNEVLQRQNDALKATLADAQAALAARQYDQAAILYQEAKKLAPTNIDVLGGSARAEQAREQELMRARREAQQKANVEAFRRYLEGGKASLAAGKFVGAVAALSEAVRLAPDSKEAKAALAEAESQLTADAQPKEKFEQYQVHMRDGHRYLAANRYDQAFIEFSLARKAMPQDPVAEKYAREAQRLKQEADQAQDTEARAKREAAQKAAGTAAMPAAPDEAALAAARKRQQFDRLMTEGRAALQAKKYIDAVRAFESAVAMFPQDSDAARFLAEAKKGPPAPPPMPMPPSKPAAPLMPPTKPAAYTRQMEQGALQEKAGRYDQALAAYKTALQALPNDSDAKSKAEFCQAMLDGEKALKLRKFADARAAYETALKLFPNDANAKAGLQRAKAAK